MEQLSCMSKIKHVFCFFLIGLFVVSCKSEYQQYVDRELSSGVTNDSLMFGLYMGLEKQKYFEICWDLNKEGVLDQGTGNGSVRHTTDKDSLGQRTTYSKDLLFEALFDEEDIMRGMSINYSYLAWAPWNRELQSDSLIIQLEKDLMEMYPGNDFIEIEVKTSKVPALVKIDGNRQILMYIKGDKDVIVKIEDLQYKLNKK